MGNDRVDLAWEEVSTEHIIQDEWIDFRRAAWNGLMERNIARTAKTHALGMRVHGKKLP